MKKILIVCRRKGDRAVTNCRRMLLLLLGSMWICAPQVKSSRPSNLKTKTEMLTMITSPPMTIWDSQQRREQKSAYRELLRLHHRHRIFMLVCLMNIHPIISIATCTRSRTIINKRKCFKSKVRKRLVYVMMSWIDNSSWKKKNKSEVTK